MPSDQLLVPSRETLDALTAFRAMLPGASWLHGAVAFVSQRGVDLLAGVLEELGTPTLKVVVRGAPITDPQAVLELDDRLGAEVRVVLGERAPGFHPKLWISQTEEATWVLSGSGNLTAGGLRDNDEQFELLRFSRTQPGARAQGSAHMTRWNRFYEGGLPLADALRTDAWALWETQRAERETLQARARELDRELATADATIASPRGDGSAAAGQSAIRSWMEGWYTDSEREVVWELLAEVMATAHAHQPSGWVASAPRNSHGRGPRLEVICHGAQVFVADRRGVLFEAPPEHVDSSGYAAAMAILERLPEASNEPWAKGDNRHPCVVVPAVHAAAARESGLQAVRAAINWRSPKRGTARHAHYHNPALVSAAAKATGRKLDQPGYHPWTG